MNNRFRIYLSGGMTKFGKKNFDKGNEWRTFLIDKLEDLDCNLFNPNDHFSFKEDIEKMDDREIMNYDLFALSKSDLVVVSFIDEKSLGTMSEIAIAYNSGIPILGLNEDNKMLHPWQSCMCNKIFNDREDLALYIAKHYLAI